MLTCPSLNGMLRIVLCKLMPMHDADTFPNINKNVRICKTVNKKVRSK